MPAVASWLRAIGRHNSLPRCIEIGAQEKRVTAVADEVVLRVETGDPRHDLRIGLGQIEIEELILGLRAAPRADHQPVAVVGHLAIEAPFLFVRPLVDELVVRLRRAQQMIEQLLKVIDAGQFRLFVGLVVAAVIEALAIRRPRCGRELDPLQAIVEVATAIHVAHAPLLPIRAGRRQAVSEQAAVRADGATGKGHGAVGGKRVRVQENARFGIQRAGDVNHALVLQTVVAAVKKSPAAGRGDAVLFVVPQLLEPAAERIAGRNRLEETESELVLGLDPGARFLAVGVFEPAKGIGHLPAVVIVDRVATTGLRVNPAPVGFDGDGLVIRRRGPRSLACRAAALVDIGRRGCWGGSLRARGRRFFLLLAA